MIRDDSITDGKAEAGAPSDRLRREERFEDLGLEIPGNARATIDDLGDDVPVHSLRSHCNGT
jgi:hypothetical protein